MTNTEKLEQEKAYKEYEEYLAKEFEESEDGEFEISDDESKEWEHLNIDHQSQENADENEPSQDS
ncbi:hypothetical protein JJB27_03615 [Campylobacter fetus subsp. venerealis]|uniref:hypothetical protein n=1 Tax=Campylobacter fetus TaxID=196 RepID=UPI00081882E5|nr:hypothetical protein [Campylobacter fetus]MBK3498164.1 hypothetical protein [Campylobacter fetus subsp. venerealis]MBK3502204.1 hypothetical protein [Campylobacter fetus subsp. venerealis]OCS16801.1 hypothetical protein CfvWBT01109_01830 [Campylobacter fetus subsp. venerealis]